VVNVAHAAASQGGGGAGDLIGFALPMVLMVAIFYFILIRPQQRKAKEHRQFLENLKRDERVITSGGIVGKIVDIKDPLVVLEVADRVQIEVGRPYIAAYAPKKGGKVE